MTKQVHKHCYLRTWVQKRKQKERIQQRVKRWTDSLPTLNPIYHGPCAMCGQNSCRSYGLLRLKDEGHHLRLVDEIGGRVNRNSGCKDLIWVHFSNQDPLLLLLFLVVAGAVVVVVLNSIQSFWPIYWNSFLSSFLFLRVRCKTLCFEQCTEPRGTEPNAFVISKCDLGKPVAILEFSISTTSLDL